MSERSTRSVVATLAILLAAAGSAGAFSVGPQWGYTILHPTGATDSVAWDVTSGGTAVGYANYSGAAKHATVWAGTTHSWTDINSYTGGTASEAYGVNGQIVGYAVKSGFEHAYTWNMSTYAATDLNPSGELASKAYDASGGRQVGRTNSGKAIIWAGASTTYTANNPTGATSSELQDIDGNYQVGAAVYSSVTKACLWNNTLTSCTVLHPASATESKAYGVSGSYQVGYAILGGAKNAGLWNGTAASWVNLNPSGAASSEARAVCGNYQVGSATFNGTDYASIWKGTAASWVNLQEVLPINYTKSHAYGVWATASDIWVSGDAWNSTSSRTEAMLWHLTVPEPTSLLAIGVGLAGLVVLRRRK